MMILAMLAQLTAVATPETPSPQRDVVVVGRRFRDDLAACIARGCPPEEEVEAAMNAATETFKAGRYEEAKAMLARAVRRNKRYAARMPGKMSDLYMTYADVANHEGDVLRFRFATIDSVEVLRRNLGPDHPATRAVAPRLGDMMVDLGRIKEARRLYADAASDAAARGDQGMAALLTFRLAVLQYQTKRYTAAEQELSSMERALPGNPGVASLVALLRAQIAFAKGQGSVEQIVAAGRGLRGIVPPLVHAPQYGVLSAQTSTDGFTSDGQLDLLDQFRSGIEDDHGYRYADIGFWIRPSGSTGDAQVIQVKGDDAWTKPLIRQIEGRRYASTAAPPGSPGVYRVERFTLRAAYDTPLGTRIRMRMGQPTLHVLDMTGMAQTASIEAQPTRP